MPMVGKYSEATPARGALIFFGGPAIVKAVIAARKYGVLAVANVQKRVASVGEVSIDVRQAFADIRRDFTGIRDALTDVREGSAIIPRQFLYIRTSG